MENSEFITLEVAMAKDWLDQQVKIHNMQLKSYVLNEEVAVVCPRDSIHLGRGIVYITDLLGLELKERARRQDCTYHWEYSFMYNGTIFFQISEERLGKYADRTDI